MKIARGVPYVICMRWRLVVALLASACVDEGPDPDLLPEGPVTVTITRRADHAPTLLAFQDDDGPWQTLAPDAASFEVTSRRYRLGAVCVDVAPDQTTRVVAASAAQALEDGRQIALPCALPVGPRPAAFVVRGTVAERGLVRLGTDAVSSGTANWAFAIPVHAGTQQLMAGDQSHVLRRDLVVDADTTLPPFSIRGEGVPYERAAITLGGAPGDSTARWESRLDLPNQLWFDHGVGEGSTGYVALVPEALLQPGDLRTVTVIRTYDRGFRTVVLRGYDASFRGTYVALPKITSGARAGQREARWGALPASHDRVEVALSYGHERATATRAWLGDARSLSTDLSELPGWDPAWSVDVGWQALLLTAIDDASAGVQLTSTVELPGQE